MAASARRIRGWIAVVIFVVLSALGVTGAWYLLGQRPAPGDIVELVNIDGDFAVAVRALRRDSDRSFLSMFERQRGERWGGLIPRYPGKDGARTGVAATAEVVTVRTVSSGQPTIMAFAARRGQKIGRVELLGERQDRAGKGLPLTAVSTLVGAGESFEFFGEDGTWAELFALDLTAGLVRWRSDLGPLLIRRAWLRDRHVLVHARSGLVIIDRASGETITRPDAGELPCVAGETVVSLARGALRIESLQTMGEQSVPLPAAAGAELRGLCGQRGNRLFLAVGPGGHDEGGAALLVMDMDTAMPEQAQKVLVGAAWHLDAVAWQAPDRVPLSGQLTHFVPVLLDQGQGQGQENDQAPAGTLAMIDVEAGQVAWRRELPWLAGARLMRDQDRHYLYAPERDLLVAFDGQSGRLTGARRMAGSISGPPGVWPGQIAGGRIWIFRGPDWAVLDSETLALVPSAGRADPGQDITAALAGELGLSGPPAR
jgi:hypothetical protein